MNKPGKGGFCGGTTDHSLREAHLRGYIANGYDDAVLHHLSATTDNTKTICEKFYKLQSFQQLGDADKGVDVPIWIAQNHYCKYSVHDDLQLKEVHVDWVPYLENAMDEINRAAPGLYLYEVGDEGDAKIKIYGTRTEVTAETWGNILEHEVANIYLHDEWKEKKGTMVYELLHALGVEHEHQRRDADTYYEVKSNESQYETLQEVFGVTRFDSFSLMACYEQDGVLIRNAEADTVWRLVPRATYNTSMSELDKVTLNILYRPYKGPTMSDNNIGRWLPFPPYPLPNVVLQVQKNIERKVDIIVATLKEGKRGRAFV